VSWMWVIAAAGAGLVVGFLAGVMAGWSLHILVRNG
jgi:hypothetical protein